MRLNRRLRQGPRLSGVTVCVALVCALAAGGCAGTRKGRRVTFTQDVVVTSAQQAPRKLKKGVPVDTGEKALYAEAPGHVGLLVVPLGAGDTEARLKPISEWGGPELQARTNKVLSELVAGVVEAQVRFQEEKPELALKTIDKLRTKYPEVTFLNFLKASCHVALGDKRAALEALTTALRDFPDHAEGRLLYEGLAGKKYGGQADGE